MILDFSNHLLKVFHFHKSLASVTEAFPLYLEYLTFCFFSSENSFRLPFLLALLYF
ncbi:hypothetical protein BD408DRAFT_412567, partial [Parasitella parasitica]